MWSPSFYPTFSPAATDVSYGRDRFDGSVVGYFVTPTPGVTNATSGPRLLSEVQFSRKSGTS